MKFTTLPNSLTSIILMLLFLYSLSAFAQDTKPTVTVEKKEKVETSKDSSATNTDKVKAISDVIKTCRKFEGLFNFFQDSTSGKVYMEIRNEQMNNEFIHFFHVENGPLNAGWVKGTYGWESIFKIRKYFNNIEFVGQNKNYYFDPDNPLSRAANADINEPVISADKIVAANKARDTFLIEADHLFLTEALAQLKYLPSPESKVKNPFQIGTLSKTKTRFDVIRNYPRNVDVVVDYVYENPYPTNFGLNTITDPRYITIKVQHSLIQMPDNDYVPRYDDPRVGYFISEVTDQTSRSVTPYRDMINRWHLKKKNPEADLSEPVEPIVFWMENTTPTELRPLIKKGVESWNIAFEKAGFKNAVVVKQQPDDAEWEAGDLRYNVLRWTSAPMMGSAWGPSFVNPRTGEILGTDIMLDYVFFSNMHTLDKLFGTQSHSLDELMFEHEGYNLHRPGQHTRCEASEIMKTELLFGKYVGKAMGYSEEAVKKMEEEMIIELVLHEVGHTLGLNHNFRSSQLRSPEEMNNAEVTKKEGLSGSVMDYNPFNYAMDPSQQGQYLTTVPGPYDRWAIEFGYAPPLKDPVAEAKRMNKLLSRSTEPELTFGNDADAMGFPGMGIDPTVIRWDMSSDVVQYGLDRIQLCHKVMTKLKSELVPEGKSYQELLIGYNMVMYQYFSALNIIKHYVGGVKIDRAMAGQPNGEAPFTPLNAREQKRAMQALILHGFSPSAFIAPEEIYTHLQVQRRGFQLFGTTEDPKIHDQIAAYQRNLLAHLLHPTVLKRMTDTRLYGNTYSVSSMMSELTAGIFNEDLTSSVRTSRQNLQHIYVDGLLAGLANPKYDHISKSTMLYEVQKIDELMKSNKGKDEETKAHRNHIRFKIEKVLKHKK